MRIVLNLLLLVGLMLASPWLLYRGIRSGGWRDLPARFGLRRFPPCAVWLHGSSVGEVRLLAPLVALLEDHGVSVAISSHTASGVQSAKLAYPNHFVFRFPFDFSFVQRRVMSKLGAGVIVVVESDLWPNQLLTAQSLGIKLAIVNGKLSARSARLHRMSGFVPRALEQIDVVAVQTEQHAERFASLGVAPEQINVTGNMKYDLTVDATGSEQRLAIRRRLSYATSDCVVIGGSLHPQEDEDLVAAFAATSSGAPVTRLIIVPRYPEQAAAVVASLARHGYAAVLKSVLDARSDRKVAPDEVVVVDTLGELRSFYAAADIVFVGGSLYFRGANKGGHNLMEPAILGLPVIFGPHNFSFRETVAALLAADAGIVVHDRDELAGALGKLVESAELRDAMGQRARQVVIDGQGASLRNFELLLPLIDSKAACRVQADQAQCRHDPESRMVNE